LGTQSLCVNWCVAQTLRSRSFEIKMKRRLKSESIDRLRRRTKQKLTATLTRQCMRWARDNLAKLADAEPTLPEALGDREQDVWEPLLAIAEAAGESWLKKATAAALSLSSDANSDCDRCACSQTYGSFSRSARPTGCLLPTSSPRLPKCRSGRGPNSTLALPPGPSVEDKKPLRDTNLSSFLKPSPDTCRKIRHSGTTQ
jgi:hypothetical protein